MKCFRKSGICVWFSQVMICLLVMIYKSHSFIAFHGAFYIAYSVCCLIFYYWKQSHSPIAAAQTVIPEGFFCTGHIRRMVNSRAALIPHFTLLPLVFDSTKDVLVSRSSAISAPLSSAKHKFTVHSCTGWGFLLLQRGEITTILVCSVLCGVEWLLQKALPILTLTC